MKRKKKLPSKLCVNPNLEKEIKSRKTKWPWSEKFESYRSEICRENKSFFGSSKARDPNKNIARDLIGLGFLFCVCVWEKRKGEKKTRN